MSSCVRPLLVFLSLVVPMLVACDDLASQEHHVLERIGYGPDAWTRERIRQLGIERYIEEQLDPRSIDDSAIEAEIASRYPLTTYSLPTLRTTYHEYNSNPDRLPGRVKLELSWARMLRNTFSKRQLEQVLVDFWYNHFNVDARTETARWGVVTYEREAIRPHVLGRFRDMLGAIAAHPSMLDYLDNAQNFVPGFVRGTTLFGPNENFARELLELHTLGVDAGYTLQDIQEVARCFTGWTINYYYPDGSFNYFADRFEFVSAGHDTGAKQIMGSLYVPAGGGMQDGEMVLDFLARHPATAHRIAYKLAQRFVADDPPQALVDRAAATFLASDGDLRQVMRTILISTEFLHTTYRGTKVKRPQQYVASLSRAIGVVDRGAFADRAAGELTRLGEELYAAAPPIGYPDRSTAWLAEGPFVFRLNLAIWASEGLYGWGPAVSSPHAAVPQDLVDDLVARFRPIGVHPTTRSRLIDLAGRISQQWRTPDVAAALLASPEFMVH